MQAGALQPTPVLSAAARGHGGRVPHRAVLDRPGPPWTARPRGGAGRPQRRRRISSRAAPAPAVRPAGAVRTATGRTATGRTATGQAANAPVKRCCTPRRPGRAAHGRPNVRYVTYGCLFRAFSYSEIFRARHVLDGHFTQRSVPITLQLNESSQLGFVTPNTSAVCERRLMPV